MKKGEGNLPKKKIAFFLLIVNINQEKGGREMETVIIALNMVIIIMDAALIVAILRRWKK